MIRSRKEASLYFCGEPFYYTELAQTQIMTSQTGKAPNLAKFSSTEDWHYSTNTFT